MATKAELEILVEQQQQQIELLQQELAAEKLKKPTRRINPTYYAIAKMLLERPMSIPELAETLHVDTRMVSQWLFQLKRQHNAAIITLGDGKKSLTEDPFKDEMSLQQ